MLCTLREADFKRRAFINKRLVMAIGNGAFSSHNLGSECREKEAVRYPVEANLTRGLHV